MSGRMHLCTKLLVLAVESDQDGQQLITDCRVLETSLIAEPHQHEPGRLPVQPGDTVYALSDQMIVQEP